MDLIVTLFLLVIAVLVVIGFGIFSLTSLREGERRAAGIAFLIAVIGGLGIKGLTLLSMPFQYAGASLIIILGAVFVILFFLPIGWIEIGNDNPLKRFDEREIMFARDGLVPGSADYKAYYEMHPEHEPDDNKTRAKPGLLSPESKFANPYQFAACEGSFFLTRSLQHAVNGPVNEPVHSLPPGEMTAYLKELTIFYGALDVGVTLLKPQHVYTHVGRGAGKYGEKISLDHKFAIAFTVEMDYDYVVTSPHGPTSMETGRQYVESARVAVQLAAAIRDLGHQARAHIDRNYRVIAPLVARDAGLGEIGRMSILMTPRLGPRVRIGVVTTDLELIPSKRKPGQDVIDFCTICEKCARACPSSSIPMGPQEEIDGAMRWKLNPDTCFRYWSVAGTDCNRCMRVCPYSHPDNLSHNIVRWGIARSGSFRRSALWLDNVFYGEKPDIRKGPKWTRVPKD